MKFPDLCVFLPLGNLFLIVFLCDIAADLACASILTYCAKSMTTVPMYAYAWPLLVFSAPLLRPDTPS